MWFLNKEKALDPDLLWKILPCFDMLDGRHLHSYMGKPGDIVPAHREQVISFITEQRVFKALLKAVIRLQAKVSSLFINHVHGLYNLMEVNWNELFEDPATPFPNVLRFKLPQTESKTGAEQLARSLFFDCDKGYGL